MTAFRVQWYPGHMEKAKRALGNVLRSAEFVVEVADARAPASTRNPELAQLARHRPRLLVLAKADLADPGATAAWLESFAAGGERALALSLIAPQSSRSLVQAIKGIVGRPRRDPARPWRAVPGVAMPKAGTTAKVRGVVVGIPNTGKSTLIRALGGRAEKGDRPGVTRGIQEFSLAANIALFDSPGLMWPRSFEGFPALVLAWLGCVGPAAFDSLEAGRELVRYLALREPGRLARRFGLTREDPDDPEVMLGEIALRRGLLRGAEPDLEKAAGAAMVEFRKGLLGPLSLERPGQEEEG